MEEEKNLFKVLVLLLFPSDPEEVVSCYKAKSSETIVLTHFCRAANLTGISSEHDTPGIS